MQFKLDNLPLEARIATVTSYVNKNINVDSVKLAKIITKRFSKRNFGQFYKLIYFTD